MYCSDMSDPTMAASSKASVATFMYNIVYYTMIIFIIYRL